MGEKDFDVMESLGIKRLTTNDEKIASFLKELKPHERDNAYHKKWLSDKQDKWRFKLGLEGGKVKVGPNALREIQRIYDAHADK